MKILLEKDDTKLNDMGTKDILPVGEFSSVQLAIAAKAPVVQNYIHECRHQERQGCTRVKV